MRHKNGCTDPVLGEILSSWRYDLSGCSSETRGEYAQHLVECRTCRTRQTIHRTVDVALISLATLSIVAFILAIAVIHHIEPLRTWAIALHVRQLSIAFTLQDFAIAGLLVSVITWIAVALVTPAPTYLSEVAMTQARGLRERHGRKVA